MKNRQEDTSTSLSVASVLLFHDMRTWGSSKRWPCTTLPPTGTLRPCLRWWRNWVWCLDICSEEPAELISAGCLRGAAVPGCRHWGRKLWLGGWFWLAGWLVFHTLSAFPLRQEEGFATPMSLSLRPWCPSQALSMSTVHSSSGFPLPPTPDSHRQQWVFQIKK